MKAQLAGLCLGEGRLLQIRLHLHDDLLAERLGAGQDPKVYVRDRLRRLLHEQLDAVPWFYLVIEDRDTGGLNAVRPHVHGAIRIPRMPLSGITNARRRKAYHQWAADHGVEDAEYRWGREVIKQIMKQATGNDGSRPKVVNGLSQMHNTWTHVPYHLRFNDAWVSYCLKNQSEVSDTLSANRFSMSFELRTEAQKLWNLIRYGESALDQWEA